MDNLALAADLRMVGAFLALLQLWVQSVDEKRSLGRHRAILRLVDIRKVFDQITILSGTTSVHMEQPQMV